MIIYFKNKATGVVEAKFTECDTDSPKWNDPAIYEKIIKDKPDPILEASFNSFQLTIQPKKYRVYTKKIVTDKRTIYIQEVILLDLTLEEIDLLKAEGLTIEEIV